MQNSVLTGRFIQLAILRADVFGSPNIGVYCFCNESVAIIPNGLPSRKLRRFENCLGVKSCETGVGGSALLGVMLAANSLGLLLPRTIREEEVETIKSSTDLQVAVVDDAWTALGNVILANDYGALVHPGASGGLAQQVSEALGVQVRRSKIAELPYVGALAVATNRGVLANAAIKPHERKMIAEVMGVEVETGTINGGVPYIRSGLLANSKGALTGPLTTGPELMAITRAFNVL